MGTTKDSKKNDWSAINDRLNNVQEAKIINLVSVFELLYISTSSTVQDTDTKVNVRGRKKKMLCSLFTGCLIVLCHMHYANCALVNIFNIQCA